MTRLLTALFTLLLLLESAGARGSVIQSQQKAEQSAELEESRQLNRKVVQLYQEKKFDEALPLAKRVLELREKALGKEHQLVTEALINLAEIHLARKEYKESLSSYERILSSNEKQAGAEDTSTALLLTKVALLRFLTGDTKGAESYYKRSLAINEKAFGAESEQAAQALYNLAEFYRLTRSFQRSEQVYERALPLLEKSIGADGRKLSALMENYACLLSRLNRERESEPYWTRAEEIRKRWLREKLSPKAAQDIEDKKFSFRQVISKPQPVYPEEARRQRLIGATTVRITIDGDGNVIRACASGAAPMLLDSSEQAAMRSRFTPLIVEGIPIETTNVITYSFMVR